MKPELMAYEASPVRFFCLATNLAHKFNVDLHYAYVSCKGDTPRWAANFDMVKNIHTKPYNIKLVTLDEEVAPYKDQSIFIKVDVEGNELKVLEGAKTLVDLPNIHWYIECHPQWGGSPLKARKYFKNRKIIDCSDRDFIVLGEKDE